MRGILLALCELLNGDTILFNSPLEVLTQRPNTTSTPPASPNKTITSQDKRLCSISAVQTKELNGHQLSHLSENQTVSKSFECNQSSHRFSHRLKRWTESGDSSVVRAPGSWLKGRGFESLQERREDFLLQGQLSVLTLTSVSVLPLCYRSST